MADKASTGSVGYVNEPLVSVTICAPNHTSASQCQTISNILLDTGSYGLRLFGSVISSSVALQQVTVAVSGKSYNLAQCAVFGSGADWGAVRTADVIMGNQQATAIPIQVIDKNYISLPSSCASLNPDPDPCTAGFNGILGVGPFSYDCGSDCASTSTSVNPGVYFACSDSSCGDWYTCSGSQCMLPVDTSKQLINPIAKFSSPYNNGLSMTMPAVANGGASNVQGTLTIGIGTSAGNDPGSGSFAVYTADASGMTDGNGLDFRTTFNSVTYGTGGKLAFIDSGSNGIFFPSATGLSQCSSTIGYYCATSSPVNLSAVTLSYSGTTSLTVPFAIEDGVTLLSSSHTTFSTLGAPVDSLFDWGLPFFLGRTVYVGIDSTTATFNGVTATGPYWGY
jgi:hypothetical protein